jgi:hypothetical protein
MSEPWKYPEDTGDRAARREAYERLARAARRAGMSIERLNEMLRQVTRNEQATRRFLAEEVYGVPNELLDDLLRVRMSDLDREDHD